MSSLRILIETLRNIEVDPTLDDDISRVLVSDPKFKIHLNNYFFDVVKHAKMSLFVSPYCLDQERVELMLVMGFDIKLLPKYELMIVCRKGHFKIKRD